MKPLRFILFAIFSVLLIALVLDLAMMMHGSFETFATAEKEEKVVIVAGTIAGLLGVAILTIFTYLLRKRA